MTKARDLASNAEGTKPKVIDAAGDLIYGTGSDAASRLAIGTAGQVLQVNSGATAPEWATPAGGGGMTVIASGSLSGTELSLTSIPGTYKDLKLVIRAADNTSSSDYLNIQLNGETASFYGFSSFTATSVALTAASNFIRSARANEGDYLSMTFTCLDYANTTTDKIGDSFAWGPNTSTGGDFYRQSWVFRKRDAITSIKFYWSGGYSFSAGTYILYGVS